MSNGSKVLIYLSFLLCHRFYDSKNIYLEFCIKLCPLAINPCKNILSTFANQPRQTCIPHDLFYSNKVDTRRNSCKIDACIVWPILELYFFSYFGSQWTQKKLHSFKIVIKFMYPNYYKHSAYALAHERESAYFSPV